MKDYIWLIIYAFGWCVLGFLLADILHKQAALTLGGE